MNNIKGLLLMDLRRLLCLRVIFPLYLAVMLVFAAIGKGSASMLPSLGFTIFIYLWVYGPSGYGNDLLCGILPATRNQVVTARYLYSLIGIVGGAGSVGIIQLITNNGAPVLPAILLFCAGCLFTAIVTPPLLYFGAVKSRYFVMGIYVIGIAATGAFGGIARDHEITIDAAPWMALTVIALALLAVSYVICLRLFARREFEG